MSTSPSPSSLPSEREIEELLPCPFCGSAARWGATLARGDHMVECVKCQCSTPLFDCNHDAAAIWNSRDASALQDARRAALEATREAVFRRALSYRKQSTRSTASPQPPPEESRDGRLG